MANDEAVSKRTAAGWLWVAGLFLCLRLGGLIFFHPSWSSLFPLEEYYRGALGREVLQGLSMPYWMYRPDNYCGGSLVMGVLAAGFFKIFGSSAFVLKSIPVFISLGALLIWFAILVGEFSKKTAGYFALFFIFSPAVFQCYSLVPLGDHYETMLISAAAVWLFLKMENGIRDSEGIEGDKGKKDHGFSYPLSLTPYPFLFGMVCGFGVWFAYIFLLTLTALALLSGMRNPQKQRLSEFAIFGLGFLTGFLPWILTALKAGLPGLNLNGMPLQNFFQFSMGSWRNFFLRDVAGLFWPPSGRSYPGYFEIGSFYALLLILPGASALLIRISRGHGLPFSSSSMSRVTRFFVLYSVLHCAALQWTRFEGERYLTPLMPAIIFFWARTMDYFESLAPSFPKIGRFLFAFPLLGLGAYLWFSMTSPVFAGSLLKTPGYAYDHLAQIPVCRDWKDCLTLHEKMMAKKNPEDQRNLWKSLAARTASEWVNRDDAPPERLFTHADFSAAFYFYSGRSLFAVYDSSYFNTAEVLAGLWQDQSPPLRLGLLGMLYDFANYPFYEKMNLPDERKAALPEEARRGYFRAAGYQYLEYWRRKGVPLRELYPMACGYIKGEARDIREAFFEGFGFYFTRNHPEIAPQRFFKEQGVRTLFSREDQKAFYIGAGWGAEIHSAFFPEEYENWVLKWMQDERDEESRSWIQQGKDEVRTSFAALYESSGIPNRFLRS